MNNILIHVPHASTFIPDEYKNQFISAPDHLAHEAELSADLYTDILAREAWPNAEIIAAEFSRLLVDVERYDDDELEEMARVGRGMIYKSAHDGVRIRREISSEERHVLHERYYKPHWERLKSFAANKLLIDLHSYPKVPWPIELMQDSDRPEIDLGTAAHLTPKKWVDDMKSHFEDHGYTVGINTPYSGVIDAGSKHAVMIELRRDIISTPSSGKKWGKMVDALASMPMPVMD